MRRGEEERLVVEEHKFLNESNWGLIVVNSNLEVITTLSLEEQEELVEEIRVAKERLREGKGKEGRGEEDEAQIRRGRKKKGAMKKGRARKEKGRKKRQVEEGDVDGEEDQIYSDLVSQ